MGEGRGGKSEQTIQNRFTIYSMCVLYTSNVSVEEWTLGGRTLEEGLVGWGRRVWLGGGRRVWLGGGGGFGWVGEEGLVGWG